MTQGKLSDSIVFIGTSNYETSWRIFSVLSTRFYLREGEDGCQIKRPLIELVPAIFLEQIDREFEREDS